MYYTSPVTWCYYTNDLKLLKILNINNFHTPETCITQVQWYDVTMVFNTKKYLLNILLHNYIYGTHYKTKKKTHIWTDNLPYKIYVKGKGKENKFDHDLSEFGLSISKLDL